MMHLPIFLPHAVSSRISNEDNIGTQILEYYSKWWNDRQVDRIQESTFSEKYWQACLCQNRFGFRWITEDGEVVEILDFGQWNREEGPDFVGALVKFGEQPPKKGDLELDRDVRDWERHYHAQRSAYRNVLVHFFFSKPAESVAFTRNVDGKQIAQVLLDAGEVRSPSKVQTKAPIFTHVSDVTQLIELAARFRMARKRQAFRQHVARMGFSQALFRAIAVGLGYRSNTLPLDLLTRRIGVQATASSLGEALLFGVAGFLRGEQFMQYSGETKKYLRCLWDGWWSYRDALSLKQLAPRLWQRTSVRPLNYPERRLGALATIARRIADLQEAVRSSNRAAFLDFLGSLRHPFWENHCSFSSKPHPACHLLGKERVLDLLVNVYYPAQELEDPHIWASFRATCLRTVPKKLPEILSCFIGRDHLPEFHLREAVAQQGLLQMASHLYFAETSYRRSREP